MEEEEKKMILFLALLYKGLRDLKFWVFNLGLSHEEKPNTKYLLNLNFDFYTFDDPILVWFKPQSNIPKITNEALIEELVNKVRSTQEMEPIAHTFHGRVPTTKTKETSNRRMTQNLLLRSPAHNFPSSAYSL